MNQNALKTTIDNGDNKYILSYMDKCKYYCYFMIHIKSSYGAPQHFIELAERVVNSYSNNTIFELSYIFCNHYIFCAVN